VSFSVSLNDIKSILNSLLSNNGLNYSINLSLDNVKSQGYAAVRAYGNDVNIYVHGTELNRQQKNT